MLTVSDFNLKFIHKMLLTLVLTYYFLALVQCKDSLCDKKIYSVPCYPSEYCSYVELLLSVDSFEDTGCHFKISLKVHNLNPNYNDSFKFSLINGQNKTFKYICTKYEFGETSAKVHVDSITHNIGSSIYINGNLICNWIAEPFDIEMPYDKLISDFMFNTNYSLVFHFDDRDTILARDSSELPWFQSDYIKCGEYLIHGDDRYRLRIKKGTEETRFWFEFAKKVIDDVYVVSLTYHNDSNVSLSFYCDYYFRAAYTKIVNAYKSTEISKFYNFVDTCTVSLSNIFECEYHLCSILNSPFDIQISTDDDYLIYSYHNFNLNETCSGSASFSNGLSVILSFLSLVAFLLNN